MIKLFSIEFLKYVLNHSKSVFKISFLTLKFYAKKHSASVTSPSMQRQGVYGYSKNILQIFLRVVI